MTPKSPAPPPAVHGPRISRRPRALATRTMALTGLSAVALAAFAKVGEDVFFKETAPFDEPVRAWVMRRRSRNRDRFFLFFTWAGAPGVIIPMTLAAAYWLAGTEGLPIAGSVVLAPSLASALFLGFKRGFRRARPAGGVLLDERTYSFPSGHAAASAAIFGTFAYVLHREELLRSAPAMFLGIIAPILIGSSRVYLDVHWATDVLGGWCVGALVTALSAGVYERVREDTRQHGVPVAS